MIAKVDSRSKTERDQVIDLAIDIMHSHLFDKDTELTILEGEGTKAYVPVVELARQEEAKKKAAEGGDAKEGKANFFSKILKKKEAPVANETAEVEETENTEE